MLASMVISVRPGAGLALRVLHAGEAHARSDLQLVDACIDRRVVGRDAFLVEVFDLFAGFFDALVDVVQGGGLELEGLQLDLLAGKDLLELAVHGGPVEAETNSERNSNDEKGDKAGDMPGERGGEAFAHAWREHGHRAPPLSGRRGIGLGQLCGSGVGWAAILHGMGVEMGRCGAVRL